MKKKRKEKSKKWARAAFETHEKWWKETKKNLVTSTTIYGEQGKKDEFLFFNKGYCADGNNCRFNHPT